MVFCMLSLFLTFEKMRHLDFKKFSICLNFA